MVAIMTVATSLRTLVLNSDHRPLQHYPLSIVPAQDAIVTVYRNRAYVVDEWDQVFRSPSRTVRVPKVIALKQYQHVSSDPKFSRRSILLRDRFCCQYCGERFPAAELTFDHVVPRSRGGQTVWNNILTACIDCNARKQNAMPNYSARKGGDAMRPLKQPRQPTSAELLRTGLEFLDPTIRADWGSFLYWNAELQT
jgi:5-methylcytosine-specific restriction endonuclease McrA